MKIEVFLFGKKEDCLGWIEFLNLEKVPFQYRGELIDDLGRVNILSGHSRINLSKKNDSGFLIEPGRTKDSCTTPDTKNLSVKDNIVTFHNNVSTNLVQDYSFNGFQEFSIKKEFAIEYMRKGLLQKQKSDER